MFLPFFLLPLKDTQFLARHLLRPGSPHHCVRDRDRDRDTHTHTHPAILKFIFMGVTIPHYCEREIEREREILEFCIEELELDCKM
jgi:hypothetical protein